MTTATSQVGPPGLARSNRRVLLPAALLATLAAVAYPATARDKMPDFEVYWTAAGRAVAGEPLYRVEDGHYQFKYLPAFALALSPLGAIPLPAAKPVWFGFSVACLVGLLSLSLRLLPQRALPSWLILTATIVTLAKFYAHELVLGQTNILLALGVLTALGAMRAKRDATAGALLAGATIVKPYAALFLPYLMMRQRGRASVVCILGVLVAILAPALVYGFESNATLLSRWWTTVRESSVATLMNQDNVSIAGMVAKLAGPGPLWQWLSLLTASLLVIACVAGLARPTRLPFPEYAEFSIVLTLIPLISPQGWDYVFLVSTPAIMCLLNAVWRLSRIERVLAVSACGLVGLSLYDVMGREVYARFMQLSIITFCYLVIVGLLLRLRWRGLA